MPEMLKANERNQKMRTARIITMKIEPGIFDEVKAGRKRIEVRDEPMKEADLIRYVDATNPGRTLGYARLLEVARLHLYSYSEAGLSMVADIARVDVDTAERLFKGKDSLFLGLIGDISFSIEPLLDAEEGIVG